MQPNYVIKTLCDIFIPEHSVIKFQSKISTDNSNLDHFE